jgi:hypothetical protein
VRRTLLWLAGPLVVLAATACSPGSSAPFLISHEGQTYRDSGGWTITVPSGWHAARFSDTTDGFTSAGLQLSNLRLPRPSLIAGYPQQVNGLGFPGRAVSLIIATDTDPRLSHGHVAVPPLPYPDRWAVGSGMGDDPYLETLWFRAGGTTFLACGEIGPKATNRDFNTVVAIVHSLR